MPTPLGHGLMGLALASCVVSPHRFSTNRPLVAVAVFSAVAADLDFLPGLLVGEPGRFHHGLSHSLGAALLYGLLVGFLIRFPALGSYARRATIMGLLYLSHPLLDLVAVDTSFPFGEPFLWPLSGTYLLSPVTIFSDVHHGNRWADFVNWHNLSALGLEALLLAPFTALMLAWRARRTLRVGAMWTGEVEE